MVDNEFGPGCYSSGLVLCEIGEEVLVVLDFYLRPSEALEVEGSDDFRVDPSLDHGEIRAVLRRSDLPENITIPQTIEPPIQHIVPPEIRVRLINNNLSQILFHHLFPFDSRLEFEFRGAVSPRGEAADVIRCFVVEF